MSRDLAVAGRFITALALVCLLWQAWQLLAPGGLQLSGAAQAAESVVQVRHFNALTPWGHSQGSGFIWDRDGHIVTNYHIVADSNDMVVQFAGGEECPARVLGASPECDIAVLELVDCQRPQQAQPLGLSWLWPRVGDRVATFGHPGPWSPILAEGVIAAHGRQASKTFRWWETRRSMRRFLRYCDVDGVVLSTATVSRYSSGGPLLSPNGRVVGLSTWRFAAPLTGGTTPRVTAGIATWVLRRVVPRLIADGEYQIPIAGIERKIGPARFLVDEHAAVYPAARAILPQVYGSALLGLRAHGARLWLKPSEEAHHAGLHRFDEVMRLGWRRVQEPEDAMAAVQRTKPGTQLSVTYRRPGDRPGYVRRSSLEVRGGEHLPTRRSFVRRWLKRGVKTFLGLRFMQMVSDGELHLIPQRRGPIRQAKRFMRGASRNAANLQDDSWSVIRPRGPIRWTRKKLRNFNYNVKDTFDFDLIPRRGPFGGGLFGGGLFGGGLFGGGLFGGGLFGGGLNPFNRGLLGGGFRLPRLFGGGGWFGGNGWFGGSGADILG